MKLNCAKCKRLSASAALSKQGLCIGCEYLGPVTVNRILKRATGAQKEIQGRKPQRRRQSFREN